MPSKKRIAFVANTSWSIYKFRLYLINRLIANGFSIHVLAPRDSYTAHFEDIKGLTFTELRSMRSKSLSPIQDIKLLRELRMHYKQIRPHLIFQYTIKPNIFGSIVAAFTGSPAVSVVTGLGYAFNSGNWLQRLAKILYRRALKHNKETWFLNEDDKAIFIAEKLIHPQKAFVLPGEGVDTTGFAAAPPPPPGGATTFLLIARLIRHKGIYEFAAAAQALKQQGLNARFQLLGFADPHNPVAIPATTLQAWQSRGTLEYLGDTDDVAPYIQAADCVVLPSYREGMPLSLLEAASMARPIITTNVAGCRDLVKDGINGYLCEPKDAPSFTQKASVFYHLPTPLRHQMGAESRKMVLQHYTQEIVADIYLDKIRTLLNL